MWFWSLRPVKNRFFIDKNRFLAIQVSIRIDTAYQVLSPSLGAARGYSISLLVAPTSVKELHVTLASIHQSPAGNTKPKTRRMSRNYPKSLSVVVQTGKESLAAGDKTMSLYRNMKGTVWAIKEGYRLWKARWWDNSS